MKVFGGRIRQRPEGGVPVAWRNLTADRKRLARSLAGIMFAVVLMFMQLGFRNAFLDSALDPLRMLDGDIVLISSAKYTTTWAQPFPRRRLAQALGIRGVDSANPLYFEENASVWKNPVRKKSHPIQVLAFDPDRPVYQSTRIDSFREALKQQDTALIDGRSRDFFGPLRPGLKTELSRRSIRVIGTFQMGPDFVSDGRIIMGDRNFAKIFGKAGDESSRLDKVEVGVIKIAPGFEVDAVLANLRRALPQDVQVMQKSAFIGMEEAYQAKASSVGPIFGLGAAIGFLVGLMISYQIMYTELSDQLPGYATLKAMGYGNGFLRQVVLQQSVFFALAAFVPAAFLSAGLFVLVGEITLLPMRMSAGLIGLNVLLTVGMCVASGAIAVRRVLRADPAEVF